MKKRPLTTKTGSVRELTSKEIRHMRSASEVLPADLLKVLPKRTGRCCVNQIFPSPACVR